MHIIDTTVDMIRYALGVGTEHERWFDLPKHTLGKAYDEQFGALMTARRILAEGAKTAQEQMFLRSVVPTIIEALAVTWAFTADETQMIRDRLFEVETRCKDYEERLAKLDAFSGSMQRLAEFEERMANLAVFEERMAKLEAFEKRIERLENPPIDEP